MSSILPKNERKNVNFCPSLLGQKFFVRFLEELKKTKCPFEINRPLVYAVVMSVLLMEVENTVAHQPCVNQENSRVPVSLQNMYLWNYIYMAGLIW